MTTKEERLSFLEEMKDVRRIKKPNRAEVQTPRDLTPGHLERQRAAVAKAVKDSNPLTSDMVEPLTAHDVLTWQRLASSTVSFASCDWDSTQLRHDWTCIG
ncbi:Smr/MutS family endonuclease [Marinobacter similis]|uniref:Smr/MutS family endonuclease n=1 Tax=Marinobacter similis TaxID=1420916 RepID=UPI000ABE85A9|nr:Smr/MutS family endonuclease [Marinobacter similis]